MCVCPLPCPPSCLRGWWLGTGRNVEERQLVSSSAIPGWNSLFLGPSSRECLSYSSLSPILLPSNSPPYGPSYPGQSHLHPQTPIQEKWSCRLVGFLWPQFSSVQFSCSVMSDSLRPHGPQHTRPPCSSPTPRVYSNSCPLSRWCHPTISPSVIPFSSCLQSFPASGSFPMSQFFTSGGQSIEVSASASVLPMNTQDWSPLGMDGWISLQSKGLSRVFSNTTVQKHKLFGTQLFYSPTLTSIHDYWKNHSLD